MTTFHPLQAEQWALKHFGAVDLGDRRRNQRAVRIAQGMASRSGKSIPKLVVRDVDGLDLFTWGPRPAPARQLVERLNDEGVDKSTVIVELQNWYNADKGGEMQEEWMRLFNGLFGLES